MANVVQQIQRPTLVMAHNKTLAAQLASEFKEFFPNNAVEYFVSYYDYYQPEAYIPRTDTYIEKDTLVNEDIERLRHSTMQSLLTRRDVLVVASVSCIYGLGDPEEYGQNSVKPARRRDVQARQDPAPADRHLLRAQRLRPVGRQVPRARRHARSPPVVAGDRGPHLVLGRRGRAHHRGRPADGRSAGRSRQRRDLPGALLRDQSRRSSRPRCTTSKTRWKSGSSSSSSRTSCSKPSACASAPSTTSRCCPRPASARASRTTRATCRGARRAARRGR